MFLFSFVFMVIFIDSRTMYVRSGGIRIDTIDIHKTLSGPMSQREGGMHSLTIIGVIGHCFFFFTLLFLVLSFVYNLVFGIHGTTKV